MPCTEKRAKLMLQRGRARIHRVMPFVIRITDRSADSCSFQPIRIKLDPGSKATGVALVLEKNDRIVLLNLFEIIHRGRQISESLTQRRGCRRRRRSQLRYRAPRFLNRGNKQKGWLAPSLMHRVDTTMSWVNKLSCFAPVSAMSMELVKFDMQLMQNPEISGVEYQQGELQGYEVREYLLEKWGRKCAYCDTPNVPLQVEHMDPKANGGSNRVSNLTLACGVCNEKKGKRNIREFLAHDPARLAKMLAYAKKPLSDAAAVNSTRWALYRALKASGLAVESGTGGRTKFNRMRLGIPKAHALDAVCVGEVMAVEGWQRPTMSIKCSGRGCYKRTRLTTNGFPRGYLMRQKQVHGFQTGDRVKAIVASGKKAGIHTGRVAVRKTGSFNIQTSEGVIQGISHRHCTLIQRNDGFGYAFQATTSKEGRSRVSR